MPLQICPRCKRFHYVPGDCPVPRSASSARIEREVPNLKAAGSSPAPTSKPPVDLKKVEAETKHLAPKKRGRPKTITDMRAYKAAKEKARRDRAKAKP